MDDGALDLSWASLADAATTLVVGMGRTNLRPYRPAADRPRATGSATHSTG
jgi:hypothetical protein